MHPGEKQSSRVMHSMKCHAAVTVAGCLWARSLSEYRNNSLKMTVLVSVISRAVRLCPWKVVGIKAPSLLQRALLLLPQERYD